MGIYTGLVRPLLFQLDADRAHGLAQLGLRWSPPWRLMGKRVADGRLSTKLAGLALDNPVGLAPGFDKNGTLVPSLDHLGFGYVVIGSVTRLPRPGNPRPRMTRYPERLSLGNNLGLPSRGLDEVLAILQGLPPTRAKILASVTGFSASELLECARAVEPHVAAVELGLVCPNTTESHRMAELEIFTEVAETVMRAKTKPVFVRLPPYHDDIGREQTMALLDICLRVGIEGVSTNGRSRVAEPKFASGQGSISGKATFDDALRIVTDVSDRAQGRIAIRASGGVFTGEDVATMLQTGATTVEVYSSLIYRGPRVAALLNSELLSVLDRQGVERAATLASAPRP